MKYIVELEDEPYMREDGVNYYTCKSARWYKLGETVINRLTPYTEPDREAIENEVWENTWKMFLTPEDFGATRGDSYSEAKAKYDAWKEQKEDEATMKEVTALAEKIGIHRLYAIVKEIRGE